MPDITIALTTLISVVSVSFAVFFGVKSKKRADDDEIIKRTENITKLGEKIDSLNLSFKEFADEIKREIRDMRKNYEDIKTEQIKQQTEIQHILKRLEKIEGV
jgi:uncharacterized protein YlxW (UPF0749 family)